MVKPAIESLSPAPSDKQIIQNPAQSALEQNPPAQQSQNVQSQPQMATRQDTLKNLQQATASAAQFINQRQQTFGQTAPSPANLQPAQPQPNSPVAQNTNLLEK